MNFPKKELERSGTEEAEKKLPFYRNITGYKSGNKWVAVIATLWYILITWGCLTLDNVDKAGKPITGYLAWSANIALWLVFLLETFYLGNSFGWRDVSPYRRKPGAGKVAEGFRIFLGAVLIFLGLAFLKSVSDIVYQAYH